MFRLPSWQSELSRYLLSCERTPFSYGHLDCGLFAAGAIETMTGVDIAWQLRGKYHSRTEAFTAVKELCGKATMAAIADHLFALYGIPEIRVLSAQRGDIVQLRAGRLSSLGVVAMHGTEICCPTKSGIRRTPLIQATRAWHI